MKDVYILAIESSCDETSASVVKNGKEDIATVVNTQIDVHKLYGGVVPEVASRLHLENITLVIDETLKNMENYNQRLYINEGGMGDEITKRIEILQNTNKTEDNYGLDSHDDLDNYDAAAYVIDGEQEEFEV